MNDTLELGTEMATWAVKDFSVALRQAITAAARRQNCTVADWLHGHFQRHGIAGQQFAPISLARVEPKPAAPVHDLCALTEAAARLAETSDRMPKGLRASLSRGLREAARERLPAPKPRHPPQRALAAPEPAGKP